VAQVNVDDFVISHKNKPVSSAKKILKCFERIMQLHEPTFTLPKIKYTFGCIFRIWPCPLNINYFSDRKASDVSYLVSTYTGGQGF